MWGWGVLLIRVPATGFELKYSFYSAQHGDEEEQLPCNANHAVRLLVDDKESIIITAQHLRGENWIIDADGLQATVTKLQNIGVTVPAWFSTRAAEFGGSNST